MKANKIKKNYRLKPFLINKIESVSTEIGCTNTAIIEESLLLFFDAYEEHGFKHEISLNRLPLPAYLQDVFDSNAGNGDFRM